MSQDGCSSPCHHICFPANKMEKGERRICTCQKLQCILFPWLQLYRYPGKHKWLLRKKTQLAVEAINIVMLSCQMKGLQLPYIKYIYKRMLSIKCVPLPQNSSLGTLSSSGLQGVLGTRWSHRGGVQRNEVSAFIQVVEELASQDCQISTM